MGGLSLTGNARKILLKMVREGEPMRFARLKKELRMADGTLQYNLNRLIESGLIERISDSGVYKLKYKTPWLFFVGDRRMLAGSLIYIGLLGKVREEIEEPVYRTAIRLLGEEANPGSHPRSWGLGVKPKRIYIITSESGRASWDNMGLSDVHNWIIMHEEDLWDVDKVKEKLMDELDTLMRDHAIVFDTTGDGKPPALAFLELANERFIPAIYVHRSQNVRRLRWLISPSDIAKRLDLPELVNGVNIP